MACNLHAGNIAMSLPRRIATGSVIHWVLALLLLLVGISCKKNKPFEPTDELGRTNKWVYDSMKLYYYWNNEITNAPNYSLPTQDFFRSLLSSKDRFSWISNRRDLTPPLTTSELFGFHCVFINHPFLAEKLVGVITLVVPGSNADNAGLARSMLISRVNEKEITSQNKQAILQELKSSPALLHLSAFNSDRTALIDSASVRVKKASVPQKALYGARYFTKGGKKTGYLGYFLCVENEDVLVLQSIERFKNAGISELVLDLRYNQGGSVASVAKLAATLVPSFNPDAVFLTYKGNSHGGTVKQSFRKTISFSFTQEGKDMGYLQSLNLGLSRVFILTSPQTASAAELLAHNLRPYMQVVLIGEQTLGKDEASFRIEDKRSPRQVEWVLSPIVYKVADANGRGGYNNGISPDYFIYEWNNLPLNSPGIPGDPLLDKALELIYGSRNVAITEMKIKQNVDAGFIQYETGPQ